MNNLIIVTQEFEKSVKKILSKNDIKNLSTYLQLNPEKGDIIPGTSGVRKLRWINPKNNKGKSSGLRILYHYSHNTLIILLNCYSKSETEDIDESEKNRLRKIIPELIKQVLS